MLSGREEVDIEAMSQRIAIYLMRVGRPTIGDVLGMPQWARDLLSPRSAAAVRYLRQVIEQMIARRRGGERRDDLVDLLMRSRDPETGLAMNDVDLRDNLLTFWAAGHETTAVVLTWALCLVAGRPDIEARILEEVRREIGEAVITAKAASRLRFTKQVVLEAMRLFPPVPVMTRHCRRDARLGDAAMRAGDIVVIPVYALHRHRRHWRDPDAFDPDRFHPAAGLEKRRFVYMPFGAGKRICIGAAFATLEATIVLATLLRGASFHIDPARAIRPLFRITMRPEGGLPMRVSLRARATADRGAEAHGLSRVRMGDGSDGAKDGLQPISAG
jgi:cytochrome P450